MIDLFVDKWIYGLELELSDINRNKKLPTGCSYNKLEGDIINSNGQAIDPTGIKHKIGGEINTPPGSIDFEIYLCKKIFEIFPEATVNHRIWLHLHIGLPNQLLTIDNLKKLAIYSHNETSNILKYCLHNMVKPDNMDNRTWAWYNEKPLAEYKMEHIKNAKNIQDFRDAFFMNKVGIKAPITFKRPMFNLYSLFKHRTIEFRALYGTLNTNEIKSCFEFFRDFVIEGLTTEKTLSELMIKNNYQFPKPNKYDKWLEEQWHLTQNKNAQTASKTFNNKK